MAENETVSVKVVFVGNSSVGKTSLINAISNVDNNEPILPTIGACFICKEYQFKGLTVRLHVWDTAGQERFRSLTPSYFHDAEYVVIVYSVDNRPSFEEIDQWNQSVLNVCRKAPELILIGNKIDLEDRCISTDEGTRKAESIGAIFYETSAKEKPKDIDKILENVANDFVSEKSVNLASAMPALVNESERHCC
ncbi:small GTP-binding protein [Histomonas meleagridis]|uniref:small GTP-binding protein n=1 Tax=Histomonas meleagridis TaxID=135588 RepID=UPI00355A1CAD|nr:small GTP-binding protein [Histomonas meleagridis]KAH0796357.1 small GTP-binding protein [Histomonas meleagridis]